jgi:hypothetical protein
MHLHIKYPPSHAPLNIVSISLIISFLVSHVFVLLLIGRRLSSFGLTARCLPSFERMSPNEPQNIALECLRSTKHVCEDSLLIRISSIWRHMELPVKLFMLTTRQAQRRSFHLNFPTPLCQPHRQQRPPSEIRPTLLPPLSDLKPHNVVLPRPQALS